MTLRMTRRTAAAWFSLLVAMFAIAILGSVEVSAQSHQTNAARAVAREFYRYHLRDGCEFTLRNVNERRRWLSTQLIGLIKQEFVRATEYQRTHPDEVPYFNGDPFTNSQEYPKWFEVGRSQSLAQGVEVELTLYFGRGRQAEHRNMRVLLIAEKGRWKIDDVIDDQGIKFQDELRRSKYNP